MASGGSSPGLLNSLQGLEAHAPAPIAINFALECDLKRIPGVNRALAGVLLSLRENSGNIDRQIVEAVSRRTYSEEDLLLIDFRHNDSLLSVERGQCLESTQAHTASSSSRLTKGPGKFVKDLSSSCEDSDDEDFVPTRGEWKEMLSALQSTARLIARQDKPELVTPVPRRAVHVKYGSPVSWPLPEVKIEGGAQQKPVLMSPADFLSHGRNLVGKGVEYRPPATVRKHFEFGAEEEECHNSSPIKHVKSSLKTYYGMMVSLTGAPSK